MTLFYGLAILAIVALVAWLVYRSRPEQIKRKHEYNSPAFASRVNWFPGWKKVGRRFGPPVLTGKRLERVSKSCDRRNLTVLSRGDQINHPELAQPKAKAAIA